MTRSYRYLIILLVALLGLSAIPAAAQPAAETRLILSHNSRFTAQIPAGWGLDPARNADYISADGNGYIVTSTYSPSRLSLTEVCRTNAALFDAEDNPDAAITWVTFAGQLACRIESPNATGAANEPIALVYLHPNPLRSTIDDGPYFRYAGVMVNRAEFDAVTASMQFTLDDVTTDLYLESAIDIVETNAYVRDDIDWDEVRAGALATGDTTAGLDVVLAALEAAGDHHSYRWDATQLDTFTGTSAEDIPQTQLPTSTAFSDQIAYINLPPIQGDRSVYTLYATAGNQAIATVDSPTTCGWIIDLRANYGGNSDPMIAAVGEILGEGTFGGFSQGDDIPSMEAYTSGSIHAEGSDPGESLIDGIIYTPQNPDAGVAVLIGPVTGSAAEYTGIAFIGREQTRLFGEPSADLTTGISGHLLADGTAIGLATSAMVDRNGTAYPNGIEPDTVVTFETAGIMDPADPVAAAATDWLLSQPACAG